MYSEVTYNYGDNDYVPEDSIQFFGIAVDDVEATGLSGVQRFLLFPVKAATDLGYPVEDNVITGPDAYKYKALKKPEGKTVHSTHVN